LKEKGVDLSRVKYSIYIIRNGYSDPIYKEVPDRMSSIAERSVDTMMSAQGAGDLYQIYLFTKSSKGDFNLAYIPVTNIYNPKEPFDIVVMRGLFDLGFEQAKHGYPWKKTPPGMDGDLMDKGNK
jgi:hypothetical protein